MTVLQAPEILSNRRWFQALDTNSNSSEGTAFTAQADCFSLSIVIWECMTAQEPYADALYPGTQSRLWMADLEVKILDGLRPSCGMIPNGEGGSVPQDMMQMLEAGWHHEPTARPSAQSMASIIKATMRSSQSQPDDDSTRVSPSDGFRNRASQSIPKISESSQLLNNRPPALEMLPRRWMLQYITLWHPC